MLALDRLDAELLRVDAVELDNVLAVDAEDPWLEVEAEILDSVDVELDAVDVVVLLKLGELEVCVLRELSVSDTERLLVLEDTVLVLELLTVLDVLKVLWELEDALRLDEVLKVELLKVELLNVLVLLLLSVEVVELERLDAELLLSISTLQIKGVGD